MNLFQAFFWYGRKVSKARCQNLHVSTDPRSKIGKTYLVIGSFPEDDHVVSGLFASAAAHICTICLTLKLPFRRTGASTDSS